MPAGGWLPPDLWRAAIDRHCDPDEYQNIHADADENAHVDLHVDTDADEHEDADADENQDSDANEHEDADADENQDSDANEHENTDRECHPEAVGDASFRDAESQSDTALFLRVRLSLGAGLHGEWVLLERCRDRILLQRQ